MTKRWRPNLDLQDADRDAALYLSIANAIALDVSNGHLQAGQKLPPQRELADSLGVALGTVTRAYAEAERRGLVRGQGRRGTVVAGPAPKRSSLSSLVDTNALVDLSANHPSPSLDPDLAAVLKIVARQSNVGELVRYPPSAGLLRHRQVICDWLREQGVPAHPDTCVLTAGAQHGIGVTLSAITRSGDEVACESLTFPGVKAVAGDLGLKLLPVPVDEEGLQPDAFEQLAKARTLRALYTIPSLQNPTSAMLSLQRKKRIAQIAARHDVLIVEDEINRPLTSSRCDPFVSLANERSFFISSASKSVAGGLRLGWVVGPGAYKEALAQSVQASLIGVAPLNAEILTTWLRDGTAERTIAARRREARARLKRALQLLQGADARVRSHADGYYVWLELPQRWPMARFAREARRRGVAVAPADIFALEGTAPPNAVRVGLTSPPGRETLLHGLRTLAGLLEGASGVAMSTL
jgi:DNA-binding transcriptional MocR family regulator